MTGGGRSQHSYLSVSPFDKLHLKPLAKDKGISCFLSKP